MISKEILLASAQELFGKEVEISPPDDIDVTVDWSVPPYRDAFSQALKGELYDHVESDLFDNSDLYADTDFWLDNYIYPPVKSKLIKLHDLDVDDDDEVEALLDEVMEDLKGMVTDGDISYPSCSPKIVDDEINWVMTFNNAHEFHELCGLVDLAKILGMHASNMLAQAPYYLSNLTNSLTNENSLLAFRPEHHTLKSLNLTDDLLHECYICIPIKLRYSELVNINEAVLNKEDIHIHISNPCVAVLDATNGGGDYDYVRTLDDQEIEVHVSIDDLTKSQYIQVRHDESFDYGFKKTFDGFPKKSIASVRKGNPEPDDKEDLAVAAFHHALVGATIKGDIGLMDAVINQEAARAGKLPDLLWSEMIGDWSLMHYAALIVDYEDKCDVMRMLKNKGVLANMNGKGNNISVADVVIGPEWIKARHEGELVSLIPTDNQLDLLATVGADTTLGDSLLPLLDDQDARRFVIKNATNSIPDGIVKQKSLRL